MTATQQSQKYSLELTHTFNATRDRVFAAWTESQQIAQWFGKGTCEVTKVTVDLRVGGEYRFNVRTDAGVELLIHGTFREVTVPQRLVYTWSIDPPRERPVADTVVTVEFRKRGDWTDIVLRHGALPSEAELEGHTKGWKECFAGMDAHMAR